MGPAEATLFAGWHEFYTLLGTAAATLVALLFVAASIGAGFLSPERAAGTRTFLSPVVAHFTAILIASVVALIPWHSHASFAVPLGLGALAGTTYAGFITIRVLRSDIADVPDCLGYGALPLLCYVVTFVASILFFRRSEHAQELLAGALVVLLMVNLRNAWDLTLSMVHRHVQ